MTLRRGAIGRMTYQAAGQSCGSTCNAVCGGSELGAAAVAAGRRALQQALRLLVGCKIEREVRDVHGECDGIRSVEPLDATLCIHALDGLQHTRVPAVEQLHALLHHVQRRDDGVVDHCRTGTSEHVAKDLVAMAAALERLLAQLVTEYNVTKTQRGKEVSV